MRKGLIFILLTTLYISANAQHTARFFKDANAFFSTHVSDGLVDYAAIHQTKAPLTSLMEQIATADLSAMDAATRKAFLINTYNLVVIQNIIDHYPITSPMAVPGFFDRLTHQVGGREVTADHLENQMLRPEYNDPRLHFVLVCGAKGCPPLINEAYRPQQLEAQLDLQTQKAMNNPDFMQVDAAQKTASFSEIFKWYESDFTSKYDNVIAFANAYRETAIPSDYKIKHYPYNWELNILPVKGTALPDSPLNDDGFDLQTYTPGTLLKLGQMDITMFNSIYTQTEKNWLGQEFSGFRETLGGSLFQYTIGVSANARINLGFDVNFKYTAASADPSFSSITAPFAFTNTDSTRFGVSSVGPRIKISPFKGVNNFSIQSTLLFPTAKFPEGRFGAPDPADNRYWMDWDRITWWNQFFMDKMIAQDKMQLFFEYDLLFRFKRYKEQVNQLQTPVSAFVSYFPTDKTTLYVMSQFTPTFVMNTMQTHINDWPVGATNTAIGAGFKFQPNPHLNFELLYTHFVQALNGGLGRTFNLGIKYVR